MIIEMEIMHQDRLKFNLSESTGIFGGQTKDADGPSEGYNQVSGFFPWFHPELRSMVIYLFH